MKIHRIVRCCGLIAVLAAGLSISTTEACTLWEDKYGLRGNCRLADLLKEYELVVQFTQPPIQIQLPNLRLDKIKFETVGQQVDLFVDVENAGPRDARDYDVITMVSVIDPQNPSQLVGSQSFSARFPALIAGDEHRGYLGTISLPNRNQDYDLSVTAMADPPTQALPGGEIWESNEQDNSKMEVCRVYGPDPDFSVIACD